MHEIFKNIPVVPENMSIEAMVDHLGSDTSMLRGRPYDGQDHTCAGKRGSEFARNMRFRDIKDCFVRGYIQSHEYYVSGSVEKIQPNATLIDECRKGQFAAICDNDMYTLRGNADPMAVWQNMACEMEKMMEIYPNVEGMKRES